MVVMLGELWHDTGKTNTTRRGEDGHIHSYGHTETGVAYAAPCLALMGLDRYADAVEKMTRFHHHPIRWFVTGKKNDGLIIKLAREMKPVRVRLLCLVAEADLQSRGPYGNVEKSERRGPEIAMDFLKRAEALGVADHAPDNIINGNELIKFGYMPGPLFGLIVRAANVLHDEDGLDKKAILDRIAGTPELAHATSTEEALKKLRGYKY